MCLHIYMGMNVWATERLNLQTVEKSVLWLCAYHEINRDIFHEDGEKKDIISDWQWIVLMQGDIYIILLCSTEILQNSRIIVRENLINLSCLLKRHCDICDNDTDISIYMCAYIYFSCSTMLYRDLWLWICMLWTTCRAVYHCEESSTEGWGRL